MLSAVRQAHCELSAEYKSSGFQARERLTPSLTYVATAIAPLGLSV
ncbi:MAG TPA: hypothetical protein V6D35_03740 [Candidatus Sericytochromatia bacterium]